MSNTNVTITEQCGTVWVITKTERVPNHHERAFWVQRTSGPPSIAKPSVVGFYAPTFTAACNALNN